MNRKKQRPSIPSEAMYDLLVQTIKTVEELTVQLEEQRTRLDKIESDKLCEAYNTYMKKKTVGDSSTGSSARRPIVSNPLLNSDVTRRVDSSLGELIRNTYRSESGVIRDVEWCLTDGYPTYDYSGEIIRRAVEDTEDDTEET